MKDYIINGYPIFGDLIFDFRIRVYRLSLTKWSVLEANSRRLRYHCE
jgi:hypothetical protein